MKFIDVAKIYIKSGDGGNGHISFRKEKFVPKGGPDGGNGGRGGDIIFYANRHMNTLLEFRYKRHFEAENGEHGGKKQMFGKDGKDLRIAVPCGTEIKNENDEIIADLEEDGEEFLAAKGGNGGFGNAMFATATNQTPRFAKPGLPGIEMNLTLEMKLLADVGLVGFPNAGKSTLISVISAAKPKIADYPFTTIVPNLGIVKIDEMKSLTIADIPGLIEGASEGKGLGHQFLRHVERCTVLVFLIDVGSDDHVRDYHTLMNELEKYNPDMAYKKRLIVFSKADLVDEGIEKELMELDFGEKLTRKIIISAVAHKNLEPLKWAIWNLHDEAVR
jgi:GTP-binding protein